MNALGAECGVESETRAVVMLLLRAGSRFVSQHWSRESRVLCYFFMCPVWNRHWRFPPVLCCAVLCCAVLCCAVLLYVHNSHALPHTTPFVLLGDRCVWRVRRGPLAQVCVLVGLESEGQGHRKGALTQGENAHAHSQHYLAQPQTDRQTT